MEVSPGLLTLVPDPGPVLSRGVRLETPKTEISCREQHEEQLFSVAEPGAVSCSALTTRDRAGQLGQAPAAGHRSERESSHAH